MKKLFNDVYASFLVGVVGFSTAAFSATDETNFYEKNINKPNSIVMMQKPVPCKSPDRARLVQKIKSTGFPAVQKASWDTFSGKEKDMIVQDLILSTTPHFLRRPATSGAACEVYGLVPLTMALDGERGVAMQKLSSLKEFDGYVKGIEKKRVCDNSTTTYEAEPWRSFFSSKRTFQQATGFFRGVFEKFLSEGNVAYMNYVRARNAKTNCTNVSLPDVDFTPILDSSYSCNSYTGGDTLLFDKEYLKSMVEYISKNRDPFGGVVYGCFPGWK